MLFLLLQLFYNHVFICFRLINSFAKHAFNLKRRISNPLFGSKLPFKYFHYPKALFAVLLTFVFSV